MHFRTSKVLAVMVALSLTSWTPLSSAQPLGSALVPDGNSTSDLVRRTFDPAVALATWTDGACSQGQVDYHRPDGVCYSLGSNEWSMKIWWLASSACRGKLPTYYLQNPPLFISTYLAWLECGFGCTYCVD